MAPGAMCRLGSSVGSEAPEAMQWMEALRHASKIRDPSRVWGQRDRLRRNNVYASRMVNNVMPECGRHKVFGKCCAQADPQRTWRRPSFHQQTISRN
jgi:hypothetical protein